MLFSSAVQGWYDPVKQTTVGAFTQYFALPHKFVTKVSGLRYSRC